MTTPERCEEIMRWIIDAVNKGHTVTIGVYSDEPVDSGQWLTVEAKNYLCLSAPHPSDFEYAVYRLHGVEHAAECARASALLAEQGKE